MGPCWWDTQRAQNIPLEWPGHYYHFDHFPRILITFAKSDQSEQSEQSDQSGQGEQGGQTKNLTTCVPDIDADW